MVLKRNTQAIPNNGRSHQQLVLQSMVWPGLIALFIFAYLPMAGLVMVFQDYDIIKGFFASPWVGFKHFRDFFTNPQFPVLMKNTLILSFAKILFGFPAPIILALMFNEITQKATKRVFQTITYMPYFLSWVVVGGMLSAMLAVDGGSVNDFLVRFGMIKEPINFLSEPKYFRTILVGSNIWKSIGYNAIIYIAAIAGINHEMYEAAEVDGASRIRQMISITIPEIAPQIMIMLIMQIGQLLNAGYEDILILTNNCDNTVLLEVGDVIDTYVYRFGIKMHRYSYSAAVGLFKAIISVILVWFANAASKKFTDNSLW